MKVTLATIAVLVAVGIVLTAVGLATGWWRRGVEVVSPQNVTYQYEQVIGTWEKLQAAANNACSAKSAASSSGPVFVEDPALAYAATYRSMAADYNRRMQNIFEAGLVAPSGYPDRVPNLDVGTGTDWCAVAVALRAEVSDVS